MRTNRITIIVIILFCLGAVAAAQNSTLKYLLAERIIDEFAGRASGETALNHIIEMGGYIHDRQLSEYTGTLFETEYIYRKLGEYGIEDAEVIKYPYGTTWDGVSGELWEISPRRTKIADFFDLNSMLASGSETCNVTADLVWVGEGRVIDLEPLKVEGKIIVTSGNITSVNDLGAKRGALGTVSFESPRPLVAPLAIPIKGIGGRMAPPAITTNFGFFLPPREGHILRDRLLRGEKITVNARVESQIVPNNLELITCLVSGSDPDAGEIIFSAHLYEGLLKQGANDNISGSAAILEIARMLNTMIEQGVIERPTRSIRFLWIPELLGSAMWVGENRDLMQKTLCNINLDMVGLWLAKSQSFFCLHRTSYGSPHYINDVMEHYYNLVGLGNRSGLAITGQRGEFLKRIVAPSGSDDPFYFRIDDFFGSSDHVTFNDWGVGVPGVMMITWPDFYYHTSEDLANKCDATQMKRVCFIGAAAAYTIASADDGLAARIVTEVTGNGLQRIGKQLERAVDLLDKADPDGFVAAWKIGRSYIEAAMINEKNTLATTEELAADIRGFRTYLSEQIAGIDAVGRATLSSFDSYMKRRAKDSGIHSVIIPKPTRLEQRAARMFPKETALVKHEGIRGYNAILERVPPEVSRKYPITGQKLNREELSRMCNGRNSALDIKKLLDAQMSAGETELQDIINYIGLLSEAGLVAITGER